MIKLFLLLSLFCTSSLMAVGSDEPYKEIYADLDTLDDNQTQATIKQYTESLYGLKAHATNYFLPVSYRGNGQYEPTNGHAAKSVEVEFQFSLKYDFGSNLLGLGEIYSAGYTQRSFWQAYAESAYFRESNYNPEVFITFPIRNSQEILYLKGIRTSFEHQSNGRGGAEERSWNYVAAAFYFQYKWLFSELKLWHRLRDNYDYNPDLIKYMGHGHLRFLLPYKKHLLQVKLRDNFSGQNAVELSYSYPVFGKKDLFLYLKAFSGYGESLIDYDHHVNKFGFGFSISR